MGSKRAQTYESHMRSLPGFEECRLMGRKIPDARIACIGVPFSVGTETAVLREAGFAGVRVVCGTYSESFNNALPVAEE